MFRLARALGVLSFVALMMSKPLFGLIPSAPDDVVEVSIGKWQRKKEGELRMVRRAGTILNLSARTIESTLEFVNGKCQMMARPSSILWPVCGMIATATAFFILPQQSYLTERMEKYEGDSREAVLLQKITLLESSLERLHQRTTRCDEHSKSENSEKLPPHYLWHAPTICLDISILVFGVAVWTNIFVHHPVGPDGYPPRPHARTDYRWESFLCSAYCLLAWVAWHHERGKIERDLIHAATE